LTVATAEDTTRLAATRCRRERLERGAASWVTVLLLLGLAAAAYAAVVFVPPAVLQYEVKQVVRDYGNQAVKNPEDEALVKGMMQKIRTLQQEPGVDAAGARIWIPVIDLHREDIVWERDREAKPPTLHVAFEYPRTIELPWLDRSVERIFRVDLTMDISRPDWGPPR
jgi:hypothetical protein